MPTAPYIHARGFTIDNVYRGRYAAAIKGDTLTMTEPDPKKIKFSYKPVNGGADHNVYSWATAEGTYSEEGDCIYGQMKVFDPYVPGQPLSYSDATFSIALDRTRKPNGDADGEPPGDPPDKPRIHVYVKPIDGTSPDEGSYTGDGK